MSLPGIDLRGILTPVIGQVADLVFPDRVAIEAPTRTYDDTGDPLDDYAAIPDGDDVAALIEPVNTRTAGYFINVPILSTDVTITLPGDRDVRPEYRLRVLYEPPPDPDARSGDLWDVAGVARDPARVTTIVLGRRREPGTPSEP